MNKVHSDCCLLIKDLNSGYDLHTYYFTEIGHFIRFRFNGMTCWLDKNTLIVYIKRKSQLIPTSLKAWLVPLS